jgi:Na+-driven multidrug efflux pump
MALLIAVPFFIAFFIFGRNMVQLFMSDDASEMALNTGIMFLKIASPFYFVISIKLIMDGMLRGAGAMVAFMASTLTDLVLRVALSYILASFFGVTGIWMSWPVGWSIAAILSVIFYRFGHWERRFMTPEEQ